MAARKRPTADPKKRWTVDRHRLLTIHDGTRLTPAVVAVLAALVDEAGNLVDPSAPDWKREQERDRLTPRLVARADGLALYVQDRRLG